MCPAILLKIYKWFLIGNMSPLILLCRLLMQPVNKLAREEEEKARVSVEPALEDQAEVALHLEEAVSLSEEEGENKSLFLCMKMLK